MTLARGAAAPALTLLLLAAAWPLPAALPPPPSHPSPHPERAVARTPPAADVPSSPSAPPAAPGDPVALSWRVLRLENGLRVVLHPDPGIPEVAVELWLRGGAADDAPGQHGAAHLFEHTGLRSERIFANPANRARYGEVTRDGNAWTGFDFLRFFTQVEPRGLELALATTADRLSSRAAGLTPERVERDRNIVLNELRRSQDTEWDVEVADRVQAGTFGAAHPYGHARSGSARDLQSAPAAAMQAWHRRHVGAANAVLLVAGGFDPARAEALVRRWFSAVPAGTPLPPSPPRVPPAPGGRETMEKALPAPAVVLSWPLPGWGTPEADDLTLFARVLQDRLDRRAAEPGAAVHAATATVELWEAAGQLTLRGSFAGRDAAPAEALLRGELGALLRAGPGAAELARARARLRGDFLRGLQQPAWLGGRLEVLGKGMLYRGDPGYYRTQLARVDAATPRRVLATARRWLSAPGYALRVLPQSAPAAPAAALAPASAPAAPRPASTPSAAPAAPVVEPGPAVPVPPGSAPAFAAVRWRALPGGARLLVVERHELPLVQLTLALEAGRGSDEAATAGRAQLVLAALRRVPVAPPGGTPLPLAEALGALGAELDAAVDERYARLSVSVPADRAAATAALLGDALARGPAADGIAAARAQALAGLGQGAADPLRVRTRVLACALEAAPRCVPSALDGEGTRAALEAMTEAGVRAFYAERYRRGNAVAAVSGDVTPARAAALATRALAGLPAGTGPAPAEAREAAGAGRAAVLIVDRPGASQSQIVAAQAIPLASADGLLPAQLVSSLLGALANQRLREEKQWSYGASSTLEPLAGGGLLMRVEAPVQTDRTADAVAEILAQARALAAGEPVAPELLARRRGALGRSVAWSVTSLETLNERLVDLARHDLPGDYYAGWLRRVAAAGDAEVAAAARSLLRPADFVWVIVGDRAQIEPGLRRLGIGEVRVVDGAGLW